MQSIVDSTDSLLDLGAGSGVLGTQIVREDSRWWGIEPNGYMAGRLESTMSNHCPLGDTRVINQTWQETAEMELPRFDWVICPNMPGFLSNPQRFWNTVAQHAENGLTWIVSAQRGPSSYCLSGFLPPELHGLNISPVYKKVLDNLNGSIPKPELSFAEYTFSAHFDTIEAAQSHFCWKGNYSSGSERTRLIKTYIAENLKRNGSGYIAQAPKRSAFLTWKF